VQLEKQIFIISDTYNRLISYYQANGTVEAKALAFMLEGILNRFLIDFKTGKEMTEDYLENFLEEVHLKIYVATAVLSKLPYREKGKDSDYENAESDLVSAAAFSAADEIVQAVFNATNDEFKEEEEDDLS